MYCIQIKVEYYTKLGLAMNGPTETFSFEAGFAFQATGPGGSVRGVYGLLKTALVFVNTPILPRPYHNHWPRHRLPGHGRCIIRIYHADRVEHLANTKADLDASHDT